MRQKLREFYVKRTPRQRVNIAAIRKTSCVEDDGPEADMPFVSNGMDATDHHEVLRAPTVGIIPIFLRYRVCFSTALVPQLQLWQLHWLVSAQSVGDLHSRVP
jgi:hypothetical protein